jgi:hypothetical protein
MKLFLTVFSLLILSVAAAWATGQIPADVLKAVAPELGLLDQSDMVRLIEQEQGTSSTEPYDRTGTGLISPECPIPPCNLHCPEGAEHEGETCPSWLDCFNGGCNSNPPVFSPIRCNQTICGTAFARNWIRDTDWYQLTLEQQDSVVWIVRAEFNVITYIVGPGENGCESIQHYAGPGRGEPCDTVVIAACLQPGTYWLYVAPARREYLTCHDYLARVHCVPCIPDTNFPYEHVDMGDLPTCNYPTLVNNPAHGLSGVAWLGDQISWENIPNQPDQDPFDDGVTYLNQRAGWHPCQMEAVQVVVTGGPNYASFVRHGGLLFLNGWKDGNLDGDFCDQLPCVGALASEWIVQDQPVVPGTYTFRFMDPGLLDVPPYDGVFRWRLTGHRVGAMGFGLMDQQACPDMTCGNFAIDSVGEVEDYVIEDLQLYVELLSFGAESGDGVVTLTWQTASEVGADRFEIVRDGTPVTNVAAANNVGGSHYQWVDAAVDLGRTYTYVLVEVDMHGNRTELGTDRVTVNSAGPSLVTDYALYQNYPNPFNPATSISYDLPEKTFVTLKVYDMVGHEVAVLVHRAVAAGHHTVNFDASALPTAMYLYKLDAGSFSSTRKMVLIK